MPQENSEGNKDAIVLNGHIHQTLQKVEGNVTFHTAMSAAFPQPAPGSAPSPGPMVAPAEKLRRVLGVSRVSVALGTHALAITDRSLDTALASQGVSAPAGVAGGGR